MVEPATQPVEVIRANVLAGVAHGFLGRRGGVSRGIVAGLNVGIGAIGDNGDSADVVAENRRRAGDAVVPGARLVTCYQVHSAQCVVADAWDDDARPHADALVTDRPGLLLGVLTADCAPVLFADHAAGVVGAAHAGWKGAFGGVTDATIAAMEKLGARRERIVAAIGPCIAQPSYEVDEGFRSHFVAAAERNAAWFLAGRPGRWQFDLEGYVSDQLVKSSIGGVERLGLDTYADAQRFFSFRRATHAQEPAYGRQIALISAG